MRIQDIVFFCFSFCFFNIILADCMGIITKSLRPDATSSKEAKYRFPVESFELPVLNKIMVIPSPEPFNSGPMNRERSSGVPVNCSTVPV